MEKYIYFINSKSISILLTDDFYFFCGLKEITGLPLVRMGFDGAMSDTDVICGKGKIRVLIDGRIFSSGNWTGFMRLRESFRRSVDWIWLDVSGHCRFYPKDCESDLYVNMQGSILHAIKGLYSAYVRKKSSMICNHYPQLSDREFDVLRYMLNKKSIKDIQSGLNLEEKTVMYYRSRIIKKFGFRTNRTFMFFYELNKDIVDRTWMSDKES